MSEQDSEVPFELQSFAWSKLLVTYEAWSCVYDSKITSTVGRLGSLIHSMCLTSPLCMRSDKRTKCGTILSIWLAAAIAAMLQPCPLSSNGAASSSIKSVNEHALEGMSQV